MAKIALIVGSVRHHRQGIKVARWVEEKLKGRNHTVFFIDPIEINLPLLDRMYKEIINLAPPTVKVILVIIIFCCYYYYYCYYYFSTKLLR